MNKNKNKIIKSALFQYKSLSTREENLNNIKNSIDLFLDQNKNPQNKKLDLLVLSELHNNLYFCQSENPKYFQLAEAIPGYTTDFLSKIAKQYNIVLIGSVFEIEKNKSNNKNIYYNTAVVFDKDGSIAGKYRKIHIPHDSEYNEQYYFTSGNLGFEPINTSIGKLGVLICFDQWYPEAARIMALKGAEILIYPTAIGWNPHDSKEEQNKQLQAWKIIQQSHAIANNVYVISCNRTGIEYKDNNIINNNHINFWGNSFIAGPQGEIISSLNTEADKFISADLDLSIVPKIRDVWTFLRDRKPRSYSELL